jgi:pseudouridine-5'-phosphate glycosidase
VFARAVTAFVRVAQEQTFRAANAYVQIRILPPIAAALRDCKPVVALESSVLAQGLPIPHNRQAAERMVAAVEKAGALAAITAVVKGTPTIGLEPDELERFLARDGVRKVSARDLPSAIIGGDDGATTVAATLALASRVGIRVFATGGIGGVHRDAPFDESADLVELSRTAMIVVCAGAKSILDLPATWERLETLGVPVIGFQTGELPGFFTAETGIALDTRVEHVAPIAKFFSAHRALGRSQSMLVVQPPPKEFALDRSRVETAVREAQSEAAKNGIRGARVTPFLLGAVTRLTGGGSLDANIALLERNAALAGAIATICSGLRDEPLR